MKRMNKNIITGMLLSMVFLFSCTDDLNRFPTNGTSNDIQYSDINGYKQSLITIYATMAYNDFLRNYWNMQELTTDEAVSTWDDNGILSYHIFNWTADNVAMGRVYTSLMYNITLCNNFIIESSDDNLSKRGFSAGDSETIKKYVAEARFMRAYFYWILMDLYGNPPFATETSLAAGEVPKQIKRADLFNYIETELKAIETTLLAAKTNEWGRADQGACWALLSRLYLNAEVYTGTAKYTEAITYSSKVINAGYTLESNYNWLMLADNYLNTNEFIFTMNFDNTNEVTWGGTNYLALGASGVPAEVNGMSNSWSSLRMTESIPALFPTADTTADRRAAFWTEGQTLTCDDLGTSLNGYSSFKFRNLNRNGSAPVQNNSYNNISDIDFPVFRLAEIYLNYAESVLRGGTGGDATTALSYINKLRGRAYANNPGSSEGNISAGDLTIDFILDERARELYWEAQRRTDLIRYNKLTTGDYLWAWKGGVREGTQVNEKYNIFPLPTSDILANPNLEQNDKY
ncbi:MAG: RagB/SusD family nutrient uptake outer membrane protein [Prolixibacteraceae bacterium]|nr:RagB/SusD family nutrient uptake outer membrane protein [Prolixibacteraceae bacterium]